MKKSTILFTIALVLIALVFSVPQLVGFARVEISDHKTPADFISKLWIGNKDLNPVLPITEPFHHIRLIGNGTHGSLHLNKADSTTIVGHKTQDLTAVVQNDTLVIHVNKNSQARVNIIHPISSIQIENADFSIRSAEYSDSLDLLVKDKASISLATSRNWNDTTRTSLSFLNLDIKGKSKASVSALRINRIDASVENGSFSYGTDLSADTVDAVLTGKSIVRATRPDEINEVKNLIVRKEKKYFKPNLIGKNVTLISQ